MSAEKKISLENYVKIPEQRAAAGELKKHNAEKGKRFVFFDKNNLPEGNVYVIAREMVGITEPYASTDPRKHTVDAFMLFMGLDEDLTGMSVEITLGDEKKIYDSPVSVFVPRNTLNSFTIMKGSGIYMKVVMAPGGDYNEVTY